jgi:hypothetical protein
VSDGEAEYLAEAKRHLKDGGAIDAVGILDRTRLSLAARDGYPTLVEFFLGRGQTSTPEMTVARRPCRG